MDIAHIASNLLRLRRDRGQTQEALAHAVGLSRAAYRDLEKGKVPPSVATLRAVAAALDAPLRELVTPAPRVQRVRFRSLKRLKSRDQLLVEVARWLAAFTELEALLDAARPHALQPLWDRLGAAGARVDPVEAARQTRAHFGLGPREPIHDICGLLEARGVKVRSVVVANDAFLGLSVAAEDGGPAVVVNTWDRLAVEHWIYSAAHELGHLVLHLGAYDVSLEEEDALQEREAEAFASHFLMPDEVFRSEWEEAAGLAFYDRVLKVKRVFRVSWRVVLFRLGEQLSVDTRRGLWQRMAVEHARRTGRPLKKHVEPNGVDGEVYSAGVRVPGAEPAALDNHDFQGDRLARLVRRAVEREQITLARGAEILDVPLAEMRALAAAWVE